MDKEEFKFPDEVPVNTKEEKDHVCVFLAPLVIGGSSAPSAVGDPGALTLHDAVRLSALQVQTLGTDLCIEADVIGIQPAEVN